VRAKYIRLHLEATVCYVGPQGRLKIKHLLRHGFQTSYKSSLCVILCIGVGLFGEKIQKLDTSGFEPETFHRHNARSCEAKIIPLDHAPADDRRATHRQIYYGFYTIESIFDLNHHLINKLTTKCGGETVNKPRITWYQPQPQKMSQDSLYFT